MKINFLGDSITEGALAGELENRYSTLVAKHFGAEECNFGVSGTRIARQTNKVGDIDFNEFICRAVQMDKTADFTFIFGGTNDYGHGDAKLGSFEDKDPYTFYGAMHELVAYITTNFPKDKFCFLLPIPRFNQDNLYGDGSKKEAGVDLATYIAAEKEVLEYYGAEYLDLTDKFYVPTTPQDDGNLYKDGLHPNQKGHKYLADCLIEYLENK